MFYVLIVMLILSAAFNIKGIYKHNELVKQYYKKSNSEFHANNEVQIIKERYYTAIEERDKVKKEANLLALERNHFRFLAQDNEDKIKNLHKYYEEIAMSQEDSLIKLENKIKKLQSANKKLRNL
jgi:hypothetical protein